MGFHRGPKPVTDGLVLWLDAANPKSYQTGSSNWVDISRNNDDMILSNSPSFTDRSIDLNGTNQNAQITQDFNIDVSTDFYTIELWFKMNELPVDTISGATGSNSAIFGERYGTNFQMFVYPQSNNKSNLGVCYDDSRNAPEHRSSGSIEANEWVQFVHIGIPYNGNQGKLKYYINGELDRDEFISDDTNGYGFPNQLYWGYDERYNVYSNMQCASVRIYKRELAESEVKQNYNSMKSRFGLK